MHSAGQLRVYVITLSSNEENLLDIIPSRELLQRHYPKKGLYVVGLAGGYHEALELAGQIVSEVYFRTGGFDVRSYLRQDCRKDGGRRNGILWERKQGR